MIQDCFMRIIFARLNFDSQIFK